MSAFPSSTIRALSLAGVAVLLAFGIRAFGSELSFDAMKKLVRTRFPEVPQLSTDELATWLREVGRRSASTPFGWLSVPATCAGH